MQIIGITGRMGSGKSTTAQFFGKLGYQIIDADALAKKVLLEKEVKLQLVNSFGNTILEKGEISRQKLAKQVFASKENIAKINEITHPKIRELFLRTVTSFFKKNNSVKIIYDAPLLLESNYYSKLQKTILVKTDLKICITRAMFKTNLSAAAIKQRISYQIKPTQAIKMVNFVIDGNLDLQKIEKQVLLIDKELTNLPQITPKELF